MSYSAYRPIDELWLTTIPEHWYKGYDPAHPQAGYLKNKSWYLEYPVSDEQLMDADGFVKRAAQLFRYMKPFNDFLNSALRDFVMPSR